MRPRQLIRDAGEVSPSDRLETEWPIIEVRGCAAGDRPTSVTSGTLSTTQPVAADTAPRVMKKTSEVVERS